MSANLPNRFTFAGPIKLAGLLVIVAVLLIGTSMAAARNRPQSRKIPVIFDTDICDDIDDTWALIMLLNSPEFDIKLITTAVGNTEQKAKTVAKILEIAGRTDIPIGIGVKHRDGGHRQDQWVKDYELSSYPGKIHEDGVQAIVDTVMNSQRRITIIAVGPLPNIGAALDKQPKIAEKARFVGMHGSIYKGYGGSDKPSAEYNVRAHVKDCQKVFTADWPMRITPLDTCGIIHLRGDKYRKVYESDKPLAKALMANYREWYRHGVASNKDLSDEEIEKRVDQRCSTASSTLFDTVAIYLAFSTDLVEMQRLPIIVTDDGYTKIDRKNGKRVRCAVKWKDLEAFEDLLLERLIK